MGLTIYLHPLSSNSKPTKGKESKKKKKKKHANFMPNQLLPRLY
ncbi:unnamed protein product, partial [Vitis vinifera]